MLQSNEISGTIGNMEDDLLTVEEAATRLKMHPVTIRRMLRAGQLPGRKVGARQWRVSSVALGEYMIGGKPRTEPLPPEESRKLSQKAATDPKWKNKTTGAKKI